MAALIQILLLCGATPAWSPDGREIAFTRRHGESFEILSLRIGDSTPRALLPDVGRVTTHRGHDFCPAWGPAGDRLVFVSAEPDGGRIAYAAIRGEGGGYQLFVESVR